MFRVFNAIGFICTISKLCPDKLYVYTYLLQAIVLLESISAKVHGVITDDAATNRKFWTVMDICGKRDNLKNSFSHPTADGRYIYVFPTHLIFIIQ